MATTSRTVTLSVCFCFYLSLASGQRLTMGLVLYHQPDKMIRTKEDLDARKENLERLKQQHGID